MSTAIATINGSEIVTKGNYHTLASRTLSGSGLALDGSMITIGSDSSTVKINGNVILPEGVGLSVKIVQQLPPVEEAKTGTIYMVPSSKTEEKDVYDEYMKVQQDDGTYVMEKIGSTALSVDVTYDPTSENPISGKGIATVFDADTFAALKDGAFVSETGSSYGSSTAWKLVDERCHAVIQEGRLVDVREFSTYDTSMPLVEGAVLHVDATSNVDLSAVTCKRFATSYIWIDIPSSVSAAPQITWPGTVANSVWLETEAPSTLDVGKRHVIVFLNDGTDDQAHYVFNYAYSYAL